MGGAPPSSASEMPSVLPAAGQLQGPHARRRQQERYSSGPAHAPARAPAPAELTRVAWTPRGDLGLADWSAVGRRFGEIGRCSQWWLGDWIHYGNERFGERYTRAVKLTGYDLQAPLNIVYVASRFETSRRRENLSWSHHAALAAADVASQERWLDRASAERLSVADLRGEPRSRRGELRGPAGAAQSLSEPTAAEEALVC